MAKQARWTWVFIAICAHGALRPYGYADLQTVLMSLTAMLAGYLWRYAQETEAPHGR